MMKQLLMSATLIPVISFAQPINTLNNPNLPGYENPSQQRIQQQMLNQQQQQQGMLNQQLQSQTQTQQQHQQTQLDNSRQRTEQARPGMIELNRQPTGEGGDPQR